MIPVPDDVGALVFSSAGLAAVALAAALLLLLPPRPTGLLRDPTVGGARPGWGRPRRRFVVLLAGPAFVVAPQPTVAAVAVVGAAAAVAGARRRAAEERDAVRRRARVVEACDALGAELAAGRTPAGALACVAHDWPHLEPAARSAANGGDVVAELRLCARPAGAAALRVVAAAWSVSARTGHGLADVLARVADDLRASEQTARVVRSELASARATARLLAALPVLTLAMGAGAGASPWAFLLGGPPGWICLGAGGALTAAGLAWIDSLARRVESG